MSDVYIHLGPCLNCGGTGIVDDPVSTDDPEFDKRLEVATSIGEARNWPEDIKRSWAQIVLNGDAGEVEDLRQEIADLARFQSDVYLKAMLGGIAASLAWLLVYIYWISVFSVVRRVDDQSHHKSDQGCLGSCHSRGAPIGKYRELYLRYFPIGLF